MTPIVRRWFFAVWRGETRLLVAIVALSVANAILIIAFPWTWQFIVDAVQQNRDASIARIVVWMFAVGLAQAVLYATLQTLRAWMNAQIQHASRTRTFEHLTALDAEAWERWRVGDLVTRLTDDAGEKTSWFLCSGVFRALEAALQMIVCLAAMAWIDPWLTLGVALPLPLIVFAQSRSQGAMSVRFRRVQAAISSVNDTLSTTFGGIRIVQACALVPTLRRRFESDAREQSTAEIAGAYVQQGVFLLYGYSWQLAIVMLLLLGGHAVIAHTLSVGQLVSFEGFVMALVWPMFDVGTYVSRAQQADAALLRLQEVLDDARPAKAEVGEPPVGATLELASVGVRRGDAVLLEDVDLRLEPGEMLALVGEVGSGKSTLLGLLVGLLEPETGTVRLGGVPLGDATRATIAFVPQDPILLSAPLRDNITLGREIDAAQLDRALAVSRLAQDLPQLPDGLDTAVGERGVTLSGGQQQRVALARALVGRPRVLVLDDATAALDAETEAAFWRELDLVLPDIAAVVVTHRVATIERASRVVVLERGRIVQVGRHADLVVADGPYRRIYGRFTAGPALG